MKNKQIWTTLVLVMTLVLTISFASALNWPWEIGVKYSPSGSEAIVDSNSCKADAICETSSIQAESARISGNVGIGTDLATQKLEVAGNVKATGICIGNDCRTSWPSEGTGGDANQCQIDGTCETNNLLVQNEAKFNADVGIGSSKPDPNWGMVYIGGEGLNKEALWINNDRNPKSALRIYGRSFPGTDDLVSIVAANTDFSQNALFVQSHSMSASVLKLWRPHNGGSNPSAVLHIQNDGPGSSLRIKNYGGNTILDVTNNGDIGIGTNAPQSKLHVNGYTQISTLSGSGNVYVCADNNGRLFKSTTPCR